MKVSLQSLQCFVVLALPIADSSKEVLAVSREASREVPVSRVAPVAVEKPVVVETKDRGGADEVASA